MTRSDEQLDPSVVVRAAVDVLLFAPLGLGAKLVEDAPGALGKARQELSNARFIGRLTVDQGIKRAGTRLEPPPPKVGTPDGDVDDAMPESVEELDAREWGELSADDLALPDYDTLPAIDIVAKLETLGDADRAAIEHYESTHRQRRTVLGKLAQLDDR